MDEFVINLPTESLNAYKGIYLVNEMKKARNYLVKTIYKDRSMIKTELESKLKCGILTQDVLDYFVHGKRDSIDKKEYYGEEEEGEIEDFGDVRLVIFKEEKNDPDPVQQNSTTSIEIKAENDFKLQPNTDQLSIKNNSSSKLNADQQISIKNELRTNLSDVLKMDYESMKNLNKSELNTTTGLGHDSVFKCDVCFSTFNDQETARLHINEYGHISASEFLTEISVKKGHRSLKLLANRYSIIKSSSKVHLFAIFCPNRRCSFYFDSSILACGLHYQYHHNRGKQVYSVGQFIRETSFKIGKTHTCPECELTFDRLHELTLHLFRSKHFPQSLSKNDINLLECTIPHCKFKTASFHSLKQHAIGYHPSFFNYQPRLYDKK
jgi:hypothetical protein